MKRAAVIAVVMLNISCRVDVHGRQPAFVHADPQDSVLLVATGRIVEPSGDTGYMFEYHSEHPLDDTVRLHAEALKLWPQVRAKAETLGVPFVVLHATSRLAAPPAPQPAEVRGYGFVFEKHRDKRWYLLHDSIPIQ
jgi:hypothetical protein